MKLILRPFTWFLCVYVCSINWSKYITKALTCWSLLKLFSMKFCSKCSSQPDGNSSQPISFKAHFIMSTNFCFCFSWQRNALRSLDCLLFFQNQIQKFTIMKSLSSKIKHFHLLLTIFGRLYAVTSGAAIARYAAVRYRWTAICLLDHFQLLLLAFLHGHFQVNETRTQPVNCEIINGERIRLQFAGYILDECVVELEY